MNKRQVGSEYESMAADFLMKRGYQILERNFNTRAGEIDIVAKDGAYYVFVEVKYRSTAKFGMPEEAVDQRKIFHLIQAARQYMLKHKLRDSIPCRFDVVLILGTEIRLIQNAFEAY